MVIKPVLIHEPTPSLASSFSWSHGPPSIPQPTEGRFPARLPRSDIGIGFSSPLLRYNPISAVCSTSFSRSMTFIFARSPHRLPCVLHMYFRCAIRDPGPSGIHPRFSESSRLHPEGCSRRESLTRVMMSGTTFQCSQANHFPVFPKPVWTSSKISTIP